MSVPGNDVKRTIATLACGALMLGTTAAPMLRAASPVSVTKIAAPEKALRFEVVVPGSLDAVWAASQILAPAQPRLR